MLKRIIELLAYKIIWMFFLLLGLVPEPLAERMAHVLGGIWYRMDRRHRDVALENMAIVFGDTMSREEMIALSRRSFDHIALVPFEMGRSLRWNWRAIEARFRVYGAGHIKAAHDKGKGVLVLTCHIGNWEFLPLSMITSGYRIAAVYRPLDFKPMDRFILEMRERFGCCMYPTKHARRGILAALGKGHIVGLLSDQNAAKRHQGVFIDVFGKKASAHSGIAQLALSTGAPVVPYFVARDGQFIRGEFGAEIPLVNTGNFESDVRANTQNFGYAMEKMIRKYPEQWFWVHRRWKTRPLDEKGGL